MGEIEKQPDAIVAVDVPERRRRFRSPKFWGIALAVLVIGAFAAWYFWPAPPPTAKEAANQYKQVQTETQNLRRTKQYGQAATKLEDYASQASDKSLKMNALIEAATLYESDGKYAEALQQYKAVEAINTNLVKPELAGIARCAQSLKNYPLAITYYQKTIDALPKDSPLYHAQVQGYQQIIDQVKEQQAKS